MARIMTDDLYPNLNPYSYQGYEYVNLVTKPELLVYQT